MHSTMNLTWLRVSMRSLPLLPTFCKIRWIRGFGTNDLCGIAIFQVIKVYFWGGMAERAELANGQLIMDNWQLTSGLYKREPYIELTWKIYCRCIRKLLHVWKFLTRSIHLTDWTAVIFATKVCDFSRGQLRYFCHTALMWKNAGSIARKGLCVF